MQLFILPQLRPSNKIQTVFPESNRRSEPVAFYTSTFTRRDFYTHTHFYIQMLLDTDTFTYGSFCAQTFLHGTFTHRRFYTHRLLHADTFTRKHFYIQTLLHTDAFTQKSFYTQRLLHRDAFTQRRFYPLRRACAGQVEIAILPQFLTIEPHFVRKGCAGQVEIAILPQFLAIEPHFVPKGCAGRVEIAILPQFLAIEPHFVRKGCVSCRLVGTAPAPRLQDRNRKEGEGKRTRGEDVRM